MDLQAGHEEESEKMEPGELLEDGWFFGNSLHRKPRMLRSMSDPCTSSLPAKSFDETYASINKQLTQSHRSQPQNSPRKLGKSDQKMMMSSKGLHRAPSLPTTLQEPEEDFHDDDEVEFSMGKLIRQASMKHSDRLPPRQHGSNKVLARNASLSMYRSRRDSEGLDHQETRPVIQRPITNKPKARKNLTELEYRELRGFNDLGFDLEQHERSPDGGNIIPAAPPVPKWGRGNGKKSSEDMKAQIKFWARAVASNVRQEC